MSTNAVLDRKPAWFAAPGSPESLPPLEQGEGGRQIVRGLKVFRVGTFKDSLGRSMTWTASELADMVTNFNTLRNGGIFPNVPVRADHSTSIDKVVGYITALRSDESFLYADIEFTEPDHAAKYQRGTYRSRSLEVGPYETNGDEPATYWPCVFGLAFVDIPAVEGLFNRNRPSEGNPVSTQPTVSFRIKGVETQDHAAVQAYIDELEKAVAAPPKPHAFRLPTGEETDYAKVQSFIDEVIKQADEAKVQARKDFVKKLVDDKKLAAPLMESMQGFVVGLTPDQYEAWTKTWEAAPTLPTFEHTFGSGNGASGEGNAEDEKVKTAQELVAMHRRSGMSEEKIAQTDSYKFLKSKGLV